MIKTLALIAVLAASILTSNASPPVNITPPVVSGIYIIGQTLSATTGTWDGSYTYEYQWSSFDAQDNNADITGATSSTLVLTSDLGGLGVRVKVRATNGSNQHTIQGSTQNLSTEQVGGVTRNSDGSVSDTLTQMNASTTGDTVLFPLNGTFTWSSFLSFGANHAITLDLNGSALHLNGYWITINKPSPTPPAGVPTTQVINGIISN